MNISTFEDILAQKEFLEDVLDMRTPEEARAPIKYIARTISDTGRLAIVVGHTRLAPGAYGKQPIDEHEYAFNSRIAARMAEIAKNQATQVGVFYRDGVGISGAYQQVDAFKPDAVIELHFNAAENNAATGTETLYGTRTKSAKFFAEIVQKNMIAVLQLKARVLLERQLGSKERGAQSVNAVAAPTVLVEPFFGSNTGDCEVMAKMTEVFFGCGRAQQTISARRAPKRKNLRGGASGGFAIIVGCGGSQLTIPAISHTCRSKLRGIAANREIAGRYAPREPIPPSYSPTVLI